MNQRPRMKKKRKKPFQKSLRLNRTSKKSLRLRRTSKKSLRLKRTSRKSLRLRTTSKLSSPPKKTLSLPTTTAVTSGAMMSRSTLLSMLPSITPVKTARSSQWLKPSDGRIEGV